MTATNAKKKRERERDTSGCDGIVLNETNLSGKRYDS